MARHSTRVLRVWLSSRSGISAWACPSCPAQVQPPKKQKDRQETQDWYHDIAVVIKRMRLNCREPVCFQTGKFIVRIQTIDTRVIIGQKAAIITRSANSNAR